MATSVLSLPIDIPWKLLAVSQDMYATSISAPLPAKWQSSLAVFYYEPEPDPDPELSNPDEVTVFLKVVASVTGYQPQLTAPLNYLIPNVVRDYYPAYAALVQVAVFPSGNQDDGSPWDIIDYPYLTDFEPKKREVTEVASDTSESMSHSSNALNVRKGTTTTNSTEVMNVDKGWSFSQSVQAAGYGGSTAGSTSRDMGTQIGTSNDVQNIVTTDSSREKRETLSHTTNLSQLYQILDSYHAGTNRALFFVNARPHLIDSPYTFVNGPRRLEGIQEFFLVARRPKDMKGFCVKATLETAHLHETTVQIPPTVTRGQQQQTTRLITGFSKGDYNGDLLYHITPDIEQTTISLDSGFSLDTTKGGGNYDVKFTDKDNNLVKTITMPIPSGVSIDIQRIQQDPGQLEKALPNIQPQADSVVVSTYIEGWSEPAGYGDSDGHLQMTVTVYEVQLTQVPGGTQDQADLYIVGRDVSGCVGDGEKPASNGPYIVYESGMSNEFLSALATSHGTGQDAVVNANVVSRQIQQAVIMSFDPAVRYAPGAVTFYTTDFVTRQLATRAATSASTALSSPLESAPHLPDALKSAIKENAPTMTRAEALKLSPSELAVRVGITPEAAHAVLRSLIAASTNRGADKIAKRRHTEAEWQSREQGQ